jgi:hypothetical protein
MLPEIKKYLSDMLESAIAIETFCTARTDSDLSTDKYFRSCLQRPTSRPQEAEIPKGSTAGCKIAQARDAAKRSGA